MRVVPGQETMSLCTPGWLGVSMEKEPEQWSTAWRQQRQMPGPRSGAGPPGVWAPAWSWSTLHWGSHWMGDPRHLPAHYTCNTVHSTNGHQGQQADRCMGDRKNSVIHHRTG